jgi:hypothetical protein
MQLQPPLPTSGIPASTQFPHPFATLPNDTGKPSEERGDLMITMSGKPSLMFDVSITNPVTKEVERGQIIDTGQQAKAAESRKHKSYSEKCGLVGIKFMPWVAESYGRWGEEATNWFEKTISAAADDKKIPTSSVRTYWSRRVAVAIQKGVADAINTCIYCLRSGTANVNDEAQDPTVIIKQSSSSGASGAFDAIPSGDSGD